MKKQFFFVLGLMSASLLGTAVVHAEDPVTPVRANGVATLSLKEDDGSLGEGGEHGGNGQGPGGGENGGSGGEIHKPEPGETGEEGVLNPGQPSALRLSGLSVFNFGTIQMSGNTQTYYSTVMPKPDFVDGGRQERPNYVQVTDNRGNNGGWNLTAKIAQQFTNGESVLTGSKISLDNGWTEPAKKDMVSFAPTAVKNVVLTTEADTVVASASENKGMGTWNIIYGTLDASEQASKGDARKSVSLEVPGSVKKVVGDYTAKIEWTLNNTPAK